MGGVRLSKINEGGSARGLTILSDTDAPIPVIELSEPRSWPASVTDTLSANRAAFQNWMLNTPDRSAATYDAATRALQDALAEVAVVGWHCSRLTLREAALIRDRGLELPNAAMLHARLEQLVSEGSLTRAGASKLYARHEADHPYRAGKIWFCFFPPRLAGEHGIRRFFDNWGGEALYNFHENEPDTGQILKSTGIPSVVEATVPLAGVHRSLRLTDRVVRVYLRSLGVDGLSSDPPVDGYSLTPITAENIRAINTFPSHAFIAMTGCDEWKKPLRIG